MGAPLEHFPRDVTAEPSASQEGRASPPATQRVRDLPMLDGLRAVAALLVILTHSGFLTGTYAAGPLGSALARMDFGVALFFCLSGFLLSRPHVAAANGTAPPRPVRRYALHRFVRIVPAYWVALIAVVVFMDHARTTSAIASNVLMTQVYTGDLLPGFTQTWSICTEVAFYVALPILGVWVFRGCDNSLRAALVRLALLAGIALVWTGLATGDLLPWGIKSGQWLPGHLDWFAVGMLLALAEPLAPRGDARTASVSTLLRYPGTLLGFAAALWVVTMTTLGGPLSLEQGSPAQAISKEVLYAVAALIIVGVGAFSSVATSPMRLLATPPMRWLGRISYAIFLWHLLVLHGVINAMGIGEFSGGFVVVSLTTVAVTVVIAWASWLLVEGPLLRKVGGRTR